MPIDRSPAYIRVYNTLHDRIFEGDYPIGQLIPIEPKLEKEFKVSRTTVRKAVEMLSREGLVEAKQGRGTVVLDYTTTQNINEVTSISETLQHWDRTVVTRNMHIDVIPASPRLAGELRIDQHAPVIRIQRLQTADDTPIAILKNYLIPDLVPHIEEYVGKFTHLYNLLEERYGLCIDSALDKISARSATFEEAEMMNVPVGAALIYYTRICYCKGKIVCVDHCKILGSKYEFEIKTVGRNKNIIT